MEIKDLLDSGYKEFKNLEFSRADRAFQKKFLDKDGRKKFFLNIYFYDFKKFGHNCLGFHAEVHFYENNNDEHWWITELHGINSLSVKEVEERFERMYKVMSFVPDIHNNEE